MTQIELEGIFAQRRAEHEAKMRELQQQEAQIQKQRNILKAEYKAGNKAWMHYEQGHLKPNCSTTASVSAMSYATT